MEEKVTKGIVLNINDKYVEDSIVSIFNEEGLMLFLKAKGITKLNSKNRMALQLFSLVEIEYFTSTNINSGRLKRANLIKQFNITNQHSYNILMLMRNIILNFKILGIEIYKTFCEILNKLEKGIFNINSIFYFLKLFIEQEGIELVLNKCSKCKRNEWITSFSFVDGGLLCKFCLESYDKPLTRETILNLVNILKAKSVTEIEGTFLSPNDESIFKSLFSTFFESNLGLDIKMLFKLQ